MGRRRRVFPILILLGSCTSVDPHDSRIAMPQDLAIEDPAELPEPPSFVRESTDEWVRLTSGEWLRGEVLALSHRQTLEFDSEELDELKLDWDDVAELHSTRQFTVLLENRATATGTLDVSSDVIQVTTGEDVFAFRRGDVQRIVLGSPRRRDHWDGKIQVGFTGRRGNTEQTDNVLSFSARRRTADTRLDLSLDVVQSEQAGVESANNQRFTGSLDRFLTSRLFLQILALDVFRDRFQNIDRQVTPSTGIGYTFVDSSPLEWSGNAGLGYRATRFDSVTPGQPDQTGEGVVILGTNLASDLTEKIELNAAYTVQLSFDGLDRTQHNASIDFSYDIWGDLDLAISFLWNHVGEPEPDSNGITPKSDDFRLDVGLSWSF